MNTYRNNNDAYGEAGPFKAASREALADEMMPTFEDWANQPRATQTVEQMRREFISGLEHVYDREDMQQISLGIAAEMGDNDLAEMIGTNGKTGDARVVVFELLGVRVAATNADPIWEETDEAAFAEVMDSEGIEL